MLFFHVACGPLPPVLPFSADTFYSPAPHTHFLYVFMNFFILVGVYATIYQNVVDILALKGTGLWPFPFPSTEEM